MGPKYLPILSKKAYTYMEYIIEKLNKWVFITRNAK